MAGNQYQFGPLRVGPYYPENLPFGLGNMYPQLQGPPPLVDLTPPAVQPTSAFMAPPPPAGPSFDLEAIGRAFGGGAGLLLDPKLRAAVAGSPAAKDLNTMATGIGQAFLDPANAALQYFGGGMDPTSEEYKVLSGRAGQPVPEAQVAADGSPVVQTETGPALDILRGLGAQEAITLKTPPPPKYEAVESTDYTKARSALEKARPDDRGQVKPEDRLLYLLSAFSEAGYNPNMSMGENILQLALAGLGGPAAFRKAELEDERNLADREANYNLQLAQVESSIAKDTSETNRLNAQNQREMDTEIWRLMAPKVSGQYLISSERTPEGGVSQTLKTLPDPERDLRLAALQAAVPASSPSASILRGAIPGSTPQEQALMVPLQVELQQVASQLMQEAAPKLSAMGTQVKMEDLMSFITPQLDQWLLMNRPEVYSSLQARIQQGMLLRALSSTQQGNKVFDSP